MTRAKNSKGQFTRKVAKVLTESEREAIIDEKTDLEATLKEKREFGTGTPAAQIDEGKIKREIAHFDRILHDGTPNVKGKAIDNLIREGLRIAEILQRGIPTHDEMRNPSKNPGAVRKHLRWNSANREAIDRYNTILRTVRAADLDVPLVSIEQLRKEK